MKNYDYLHSSRNKNPPKDPTATEVKAVVNALKADLEAERRYGKSMVEELLKLDNPCLAVNEINRNRIRPMSYSHAFWEDVEKYFAHIDLPKENTKMYTITRPGKGMPRSLSGVKFPSYEKARQAIRKWVRSNLGREGYLSKSGSPWHMWDRHMWDSTSRNPTNVVSALGFKIKSTTGV